MAHSSQQAPWERLFARRRFGIKPGLETIRALLAGLGNPQESFLAIHVAGTNGKGSVAAMLEGMLRSQGLAVGLYTSPHLVHFRERFRLGGHEPSDEDMRAALATVEQGAAPLESEGRPVTFFEFSTAMAFVLFARAGMKLAIVECGLGGRWDATNVVLPLLSIITRIDRDHQQWLGESLTDIAAEKGGIIKPGRPVVLGGMPADAEAELVRMAKAQEAPLSRSADLASVQVRREHSGGFDLTLATGGWSQRAQLALPGRFQLENVVTALGAMEVLQHALHTEWDPEALAEGLAGVRWPGRFQVLSEAPPMVLDGAHNAGGARCVVETVRRLWKGRPVALVLGLCEDKATDEFLKAFDGVSRRVWAVALENERGMDPERLAGMAASDGRHAQVSPLNEALQESCDWARQETGVVVITGSLFLVGQVLALGDALASLTKQASDRVGAEPETV